MADVYWDDVSLLLIFEGANGETSFVDVSSAANTITTNGDAQIQSNLLELDGTGDFLALPNSSSVIDETAALTIEAIITFDDPENRDDAIFSTTDSGPLGGIVLYQSYGAIYFEGLDGAGFYRFAFGGGTIAAATQYHIEASRDGSGNWRLFLDGTQLDVTTAETGAVAGGDTLIRIGYSGQGWGYSDGKIKALRVTPGITRHTAGFTAPTAFDIDVFYTRTSAPSPLGAPAIEASVPVIYTTRLEAVTALGAPAILTEAQIAALISLVTPLGSPAIVVDENEAARLSAVTPLGCPSLLSFNDFTSIIPDGTPSYYVMDLTVSGEPVRVPIKSWQATLNAGQSNYVQCVIPSAGVWLSQITAATNFTIYRVVEFGGVTIEYEMASCPATYKPIDQGPINYTCTMSGYTDGFTSNPDPDTTYDRVLQGVRSISQNNGTRVRCAVDFLLRPGQRAYVDGSPIIVSYINYYVLTSDSYMDVGERL